MANSEFELLSSRTGTQDLGSRGRHQLKLISVVIPRSRCASREGAPISTLARRPKWHWRTADESTVVANRWG